VPLHADGGDHFAEGTAEIAAAFELRRATERLVLLSPGDSVTFRLDLCGELHRSVLRTPGTSG
jgi:hypothetical protein